MTLKRHPVEIYVIYHVLTKNIIYISIKLQVLILTYYDVIVVTTKKSKYKNVGDR